MEAIGFKLMYGQARCNSVIVAFMMLNRVFIAHLTRSNLLHIMLSEEAVAVRGVQHTRRGVSDTQVYLDTSSLLDRLKRKEAINRMSSIETFAES